MRSRAKWIKEGEKSTKSFFTLEKTRAQKNKVESIYNSEGAEVFSQEKVEQAHVAFHCTLYSKEPVNLFVQ